MTPRFWVRVRCVLIAIASWAAFIAAMAEMARSPVARPQPYLIGGSP